MKKCALFVVSALILVAVPFSFVWAESAKPIVLGAVGPLSSITGRDCLRAAELAVEEINSKGGVTVGGVKRPLKIVSADTRDNAPGVPVTESIMGYEKIILEHKPTALIINCHRSEAMLASMDLIAKHNVPTLISISVSPVVDKKIAEYMSKGVNCFFHTSNNVVDWARAYGALMKVFKERGLERVYGVYSDNLAFRALWKMVDGGLKKAGLEVLGVDAVPIGASDFSGPLFNAKRKKAQVLWSIYETGSVGILAKQFNSLKVPALLFVMAGPFVSQRAWDEYGDELNGVLVQLTESGGMPTKKYPPATVFFDKCVKKWPDWEYAYGHGPANTYDSIYLLVDAIERANTTEGASLYKELEKTDMKGVTGRVKFNAHHKIVYGMDPEKTAFMVFFQWQDGSAVPVSPASVAEGTIKLPIRIK